VVHLRGHDITGGPGWLIDMLALTRMRLQTDALPDQAQIDEDSAIFAADECRPYD
jgi:hypothetical protein